MTNIGRVFIGLGPDCVAEGFYTLTGNKITMTYANGEPVLTDGDEPVTATATPDTIEPVARALTRRIRKWALGDSVPGFGRGETIASGPLNADGFGRRLQYENEAFA